MKNLKMVVLFTLKITVLIVVVAVVLYAIFWFGGKSNPKIVYQSQTIDKSEERFDTKIDGLKNDLVEKLRKCESGGYSEDDGIIIFDTNSKASVGTLQFQKATVQYYYKTLYGKVITGKEAVLIAIDGKSAGELARDIMFTTKNMAGKDWYNCAVRLNLDDEIVIIKKLETK